MTDVGPRTDVDRNEDHHQSSIHQSSIKWMDDSLIGWILRKTTMRISAILMAWTLGILHTVHGFVTTLSSCGSKDMTTLQRTLFDDHVEDPDTEASSVRRDLLHCAAVASGSVILGGAYPFPADAAVGTLPEFADSDAIIQGVTVNVADKSQQDAMIDFLVRGFDFDVLRKRFRDTVEETWLGFGPEQLSIPDEFEFPVSSFAKYGGHASIKIRFDSKTAAPLYRTGDDAPGNNIAFLQVGVPGYRISQMVEAGGKITDAYGLVNVVSPSGLPLRGIVGISPDPIMFIAINCKDVKDSRAFYEQLGFVEQDYPFSRPSKGTTMFEPDKPKKAAYMAPSAGCMGVLLLQSKAKKISANPAFESLNILYTPSGEGGEDGVELKDPSGVAVKFQSAAAFSAEEKLTR